MEGLPRRNILIGVDESQASEKAVGWAVDNLYKEGDEVHLFHVIPPGTYMLLAPDMGMDGIIEEDEATRQRAEDNAKAMLVEKFAGLLQAKQIPFKLELVRFATDNDSIGAVICRRAAQLNAAAVVMAKHNKGRLREFFVGSVTNYCTHHCKSPLLIMHCDE